MKKTFSRESPGHAPARVIESIKNDIRKYLKRERRKPLPEGVDFWDFDCRVGPGGNEEAAVVTHVTEVPAVIDQVASGGAVSVYVEILAKAGHRSGVRAARVHEEAGEDAAEDDFHG